MNQLKIQLLGQPPSGKNSVVVTRSGLRFPNKRFVEWRKIASEEILKQLSPEEREKINKDGYLINEPVSVSIGYITGDKRRRDVPGMIDALWHLLEKCGIVSDDTFLGGLEKELSFKNLGYIKNGAVVNITIG